MAYPKLTPITATGSTAPRYLGDRFADIVNVKDFGAVGDGVADDTTAFTAAQNSGAQAVMVPNGTYKITEDVTGVFFSFGSITTTGGGDVEIIDILSGVVTKVALDGSNLSGAAVKAVVETWHSGTEWYRVWSDGWIEQGGLVTITQSEVWQYVNLHKPFANTDYTVLQNGYTLGDSAVSGSAGFCVANITTSTFRVLGHTTNIPKKYWYACGY